MNLYRKFRFKYHVAKAEFHLLMANYLGSLKKVDYHREKARKSIIICLYLSQYGTDYNL